MAIAKVDFEVRIAFGPQRLELDIRAEVWSPNYGRDLVQHTEVPK